jgi:NAD(P)-dependent dehydrogenase (short-subunit alcohol dehydrogenase family)
VSLDHLRLDGRVALVTGAGGGIGGATARLLAEAGADVVATDADGETLARTAAAIESGGGRAASIVRDLAEPSAPAEVVEQAAARWGRLDVLANVAGTLHAGTLADTSEEDLDRVLAVNLRAAAACARASVAAMSPENGGRGGSIVNITSSIVARAVPGFAAYAMSKGGVVALTKALAVEAAPLGIRVNAVAPGLVVTPMSVGRRTGEEQEAFLETAVRGIPVGRAGEPDDIAHAVLFLATDATSYVTGQTLFVNGGSVMPT